MKVRISIIIFNYILKNSIETNTNEEEVIEGMEEENTINDNENIFDQECVVCLELLEVNNLYKIN